MNSRNLEYVFFGQVGKDRSGGAREQGFSRSRRSVERNVVRARGRDDESALRRFLSPYLIEREIVFSLHRSSALLRSFAFGRFFQFGKRVFERGDAVNAQFGNKGCFRHILFRKIQVGESTVARGESYRKRPQDPAYVAVQGKFACEQFPFRVELRLLGRKEEREREREVEYRPFFLESGGRKREHYLLVAFLRRFQALRVFNRRSDAVFCFLDRFIGKADNGECVQSFRNIAFD